MTGVVSAFRRTLGPAKAGHYDDGAVSRERTQVRHLAIASVVILVIVSGLRMAAPQLAPRVNVRWAPGVSDEQRVAAERTFRLVSPTHVEDSTWTYDLSDPSAENIKALVAHAAVEDTYGINRQDGVVEPDAPRGTTWVESSAIGAWAASEPVAWVGLISMWATLLSCVWLVFNRYIATPGTSPSTPASSRLSG
jgi:hypothetical protein